MTAPVDRLPWWQRPLDGWAGRGLLAFFLVPLGAVGTLNGLSAVVSGDVRGGRLLGVALVALAAAALAVVVRIVRGRAATWDAVVGLGVLLSAGLLFTWTDSTRPKWSWGLAGLAVWLLVNRVRPSRTTVAAPPAEPAGDVTRA